MVDGSALFTRNFYNKFFRVEPEGRNELRIARWSSVGVVVSGIVVAFLLTDVVSGLTIVWRIMAFLGIPFWMAVFWRRSNRYGLWVSVFVTTAIALYTQSVGWGLAEQIAVYLPAGVLAFVIASVLTRGEPEEKVHVFYTLLHTPVGEEQKLAEAGIKPILEGQSVAPRRRDQSVSLEEQGHSLLLVDLLSLHRKFSFKRYRVDLLGFGAATLMICSIIAIAIVLSRIGT
jgi:Na+/proline symporter